MTRLVVCLVLVVLVLFTGCARTEVPQYFQRNFSAPEPKPLALKCAISNTTYYQQSFFIYHVTQLGDRVVYSPVGSYTMPENYSRWQFRTFLDKDDSLYVKTQQYIAQRRLPNGESIACEEVPAVPRDFRDFIRTHENLFKAQLINRSREIVL